MEGVGLISHLCLHNSTPQDASPIALATPHIDMVLNAYKDKGVTTPEVTTTSELDSSHQEGPEGTGNSSGAVHRQSGDSPSSKTPGESSSSSPTVSCNYIVLSTMRIVMKTHFPYTHFNSTFGFNFLEHSTSIIKWKCFSALQFQPHASFYFFPILHEKNTACLKFLNWVNSKKIPLL